MNNTPSHHTTLNGTQQYSAALDALCALAQKDLYFFDKNFDGAGFNSADRFDTLRQFLLNNPENRLYILAHDTHYLATQSARILMLQQQFAHSMQIFQTPKNLRHLSEPFAIADTNHIVRRFHFDDPRGAFDQHDPSLARTWQARFLEMWAHSHASVAANTLGL